MRPLRLVGRFVPALSPRSGLWPCELPVVLPMDTVLCARAQSLLTGSLIGGVCPPLRIDQARDVLRWAGELP